MANKAIIEKWVEALESGDYRQTMGTLRNSEGFCCLGVLTDLAVKDGVLGQGELEDGSFRYGVGEEAGILPEEVVDWAGLNASNPPLDIPESIRGETGFATENATTLNDSMDFDFGQIAACVRETYL